MGVTYTAADVTINSIVSGSVVVDFSVTVLSSAVATATATFNVSAAQAQAMWESTIVLRAEQCYPMPDVLSFACLDAEQHRLQPDGIGQHSCECHSGWFNRCSSCRSGCRFSCRSWGENIGRIRRCLRVGRGCLGGYGGSLPSMIGLLVRSLTTLFLSGAVSSKST